MKHLDLAYLISETVGNLRRNLTLAAATVITVAVSLALVGAAFLLRQGVANATQQWEGGIEFIVYMDPDASRSDITETRGVLDRDPAIKSATYLDKDDAYDEFIRLFGRDSRLVETVTPDVLPTNFKVVPERTTADAVQQLVDEYETLDGVYRVVAATDTIKTMQRVSSVVSTGIFAGAVVLVIAGIVLVVNTIRTAMVARRREVEVMRLVGASNWFIRVPFMLEGTLQGLTGAAVAVAATVGLNRVFSARLANADGFDLLRNFVVSTSDVRATSLVLLVVGATIGTAGSAVAVRRHLTV